jgi:hypothetical protein
MNYKTNVPEIDQENEYLLRAANLLEQVGNDPGMTSSEFYKIMTANAIDISHQDFSKLATAAIAIETMMEFCSDLAGKDLTVH